VDHEQPSAFPPKLLRRGNFWSNIPEQLPREAFAPLCEGPGLRIERIVSRGQCTPPNEWYDQDTDEWVILWQGRARLEISGEPTLVELGPGDYLWLPAHLRHRVAWTDPTQDCVWLAVHHCPATALGE